MTATIPAIFTVSLSESNDRRAWAISFFARQACLTCGRGRRGAREEEGKDAIDDAVDCPGKDKGTFGHSLFVAVLMRQKCSIVMHSPFAPSSFLSKYGCICIAIAIGRAAAIFCSQCRLVLSLSLLSPKYAPWCLHHQQGLWVPALLSSSEKCQCK